MMTMFFAVSLAEVGTEIKIHNTHETTEQCFFCPTGKIEVNFFFPHRSQKLVGKKFLNARKKAMGNFPRMFSPRSQKQVGKTVKRQRNKAVGSFSIYYFCPPVAKNWRVNGGKIVKTGK